MWDGWPLKTFIYIIAQFQLTSKIITTTLKPLLQYVIRLSFDQHKDSF